MDILMIGTGNAFAKKYYNNNALIYGHQFNLLIDCGTTAPLALHELEIELPDINAVLLTHIHADHVGGIEEFAFRMRFVHSDEPKRQLLIPETLIEPLWEHTLKGGLAQYEWETLQDFFDVVPLKEDELYTLTSDLQLQILRTDHIPNKLSYSVLINDNFFYSADMQFNPELVTSLVRDQGRLVFHDCQIQPPGLVHAALDDLLTLPEDVQRHIMLMHYPDFKDEYIGKTGCMEFVEQHKRYSISNLLQTIKDRKL